jgi:hypothetical protein
MAQFMDMQISDSTRETLISEGVNSIPLALAYYGQHDVRILRYKWLAEQLERESLRDIVGRDHDVWLLVSGPSRAAKLLEENGFQLAGKPILYGHILLSHYRAGPQRPELATK